MAAFKNLFHLLAYGLDLSRLSHLDIHGIDPVDGNKVLEDGGGNQHRFGIQFGLSEALDLFLEGSDDGELEAVNLNQLAWGCGLTFRRAALASLPVSRATFCRRARSVVSRKRPESTTRFRTGL